MGKEFKTTLLLAFEQEETYLSKLMDMLEKLPKRNRRLSPGYFWEVVEL